MKIAVTGASGFVGRHVVRCLAERDVHVIACGRDPARLRGAAGNVEAVHFDVRTDEAGWFARLGAPDALIHLAWGGLPHYKSLHHFEQELPAHYRVLKDMIRDGLKTLVVSGTCFEYGLQSGALREDMAALPVTPYGFAKDMLRRQLEFLKAEHNHALIWGRLFYLFGEGQSESSLFASLRRAALRGDEAFAMSGGEQLRDYLPAAEAARLLAELALRGGDAGVVNICSGRPISVRGLVEGWLAEKGWSLRLDLGRYPYPDYEPMAFWGDRRRLDEVLGACGAESQLKTREA